MTSPGSLWQMLGRATTRWRRPATFALVGATNTAVDLAIFAALTLLAGFAPLLANAVSFSLAAVNSFVLNGLLTFADRGVALASAARAGRFALVTLATLAVSTLVLWLALPFMPAMLAKVVSIGATFLVGYALSSRLVYR